jgi:hypothetical protein
MALKEEKGIGFRVQGRMVEDDVAQHEPGRVEGLGFIRVRKRPSFRGEEEAVKNTRLFL